MANVRPLGSVYWEVQHDGVYRRVYLSDIVDSCDAITAALLGLDLDE